MSNFKTKTMKTTKLLAILFISALSFTACSEDDDHDHDETHGNASDILGDRYACLHQREGRSTDRRHGRRAIGLEHFTDDSDGVRKVIAELNQRLQSAVSECTVSDFSTARAA